MKTEYCLFCDIVERTQPAQIVHETDQVIAFKDIRPRAPFHLLIIPKIHIATLNDILPEHQSLIGEIFIVAKILAKQFGVSGTGYRTVFNCNRDAGQEVYHIHLHLLGGRQLFWPPG